MSRRWLWLALPAALAAIYLARDRPPAPPPERASAKPRPAHRPLLARPAVPGAPCRLEGTVRGGTAVAVRVHVEAAELDVDAELEGGGARFSAALPEQGRLLVAARSDSGATAERWVECGGDGALSVELAFPERVEGYARLSGRCVYVETGAPVAAAVVRGERWGREGVAWSALAGEDGSFAARVPPGDFQVRCAKDGDQGEALRLVLVADEERGATLFVEARASVRGRVVDQAGEGVGFAQVTARAAADPLVRARADEHGYFLLRGLALGPARIEAQSEGRFAEAHPVLRGGPSAHELRLVLRDGALVLSGRVSDRRDNPLPGAKVLAEASDGTGLEREVECDEDGRYLIAGLSPGGYQLSARATGYVTGFKSERLELSRSIDWGLERGCAPRVLVLPDSPRQAVAIDAFVGEERFAARERGLTGEPITLSGVSGALRLRARTLGSVVRTATLAVDACSAPDPVVIELGGREESGAIDITVVDREQQPLAGAGLWITPHVGRARTDEAGRASAEALPPGSYRVSAADDLEPSFSPRSAEVEVQAGQRAAVRLVLDRSRGQVSGTVVRGGRPVEAAVVRAQCGDGGGPRSLAGAEVVARTDASGHFEFTPEDGGLCLVRAEHPTEGTSEPVTLKAGALGARLELEGYASVEGRVVAQPVRSPVTEYTLTVRALGRAADVDVRTLVIADPAGQFRVEALPAGALSLSVRAGGGRAHAELELSPGERRSGVELVIFGEGQVRGRVVSSAGPVAGARVSLRGVDPAGYAYSGAELGALITGEDGRFERAVQSGAPLRVYVSADGYYPWGSAPFDLLADRPVELGEIALQPRADEKEKEGGIGIRFSADPKGVRVVELAPDSPARDAGIEVGDVIVSIDGTPAGRLPMVNWVVLLRGPPGTRVMLEVERGGQPPFTVAVVRRAIGLPALPTEAP